MKRSRLYLFVAILCIAVIFATAAICNRCSIIPTESSLEATETTIDETTTKKTGSPTTTKKETSESQDSTEETEESEEAADDESDDNSAPVIDEVSFSSEGSGIFFDAMNPATSEILQNVPPLAAIELSIGASDPDEDDLNYFVSDSLGNNFEVNKLNNYEAEASLSFPADIGPYVINILVTDDEGGQASFDMNTQVIDLEEEPDLVATRTAQAFPYAALSGSIVKDTAINLASDASGTPVVYFGDSGSNKQVKGFFSFDISALHGKTILNAFINCPSMERIGNPTFAEYIDVKADDLGSSIDYGDFAVGGVFIKRFATSSSSITIDGDALKNAIQNIADTGSSNYLQIKVGLSSSASANSQADGFNVYLSNMELLIDYE